MMTIREMKEQFEIQGAYQIATYDFENETRITLAEGYELNFSKIEDKYLDAEISYMYADDNRLIIEINFI